MLLQKQGSKCKKRNSDTFEVVKYAILELLGHRIEGQMTWLIEFSGRNTWNFFQNFSSSPFSGNEENKI